MKREFALILAFFAFMTGCASTSTLIRSEPPGAEVTIENRVIGNTPISYDLNKGLNQGPLAILGRNQTAINFHLEGYEDDAQIVRKVEGSFGSLDSRWPREVNIALTPSSASKTVASGTLAQPSAPSIPAPAAPIVPAFHSDIDTPTYKIKEIPDNFAVVIGIEKYSALPDAEFAARDAEAVRNHLIALGYPKRNVIFLTGQNATRVGMQKYLDEWLPRNVKPGSTVFFYYSGHGAPDTKTGEAYLVPWDGDAKFLESTAYPLKQLYGALNKLPVKEVIVALDSCFSGAGGRSVLAKGARPLVITTDTGIFPIGKMILFGAASGDEITSSLEDQGHGMFTYYFLKGLSGAAKNNSGAVTVKGLYDYLKPLVQDEARRQNREQTPVLQGTHQDQVIIRFD